MQKTILILAIALGSLLLPKAAHAQDTNPIPVVPQTRLEALGTNVGTIIVRATSPVGTVAASGGALTVKCKDFTDAGTGRREMGLSIDFILGNEREDVLLIDYNEITPFLSAIDYLSNVGWSVTSFPIFDASFTTRGGFRLAAFGGRRSGAIEYTARTIHYNVAPLQLSLDQMAQLRALVAQGKATLDGIRAAK